MSVTRRLFNVARAELKSVFRRHEDEPQTEHEAEPPRPSPAPGDTPEIRRFYANLELPFGASIDEVKAAYRRMMRSYHPDHHANDPERLRVATELAHQLRAAYDGLVAHLSRR
jgi:DnaJ-domain-containing protein 1